MQDHKLNAAELYASNIQNLTELWIAIGAKRTEDKRSPVLHASESWPDRLWFDVGARLERADALRLIDAARAATHPVVLPAWCRHKPGGDDLTQRSEGWSLRSELDATGFRLSFEQTLMGLDLEGWRPRAEPAAAVATEVELQSVACDTADWADLASRSFGYPVPAAVTERLVQKPGVRMFIARQHGQPVGTGLIYARGKSAGIHMVGVVPEARRLGIARGIMMRLLNDVRARGFCVATLQASHMGERLYRELGFRPQGRIHNFQLR